MECRLVIELDGEYHIDAEQLKYDKDRDQVLSELGIRTIRFTNIQIDDSFDSVIREIKKNLFLK